MRHQLGAYLDELAYDDDTKVVLLRGEGGVFSTGADMNNAYAWYGDGASKDGATSAGPSQRRRLLTDRQTFDFYQFFLGYPKVTVAEVVGLRARRRLRAGAHGRHRRRGRRHADRDARHPLPRPGARLAPPLLPPPRPGARPPPAAHRRHHQGRRGRPPRRLHRGRRARRRRGPRRLVRREGARACRPTASCMAKEAFRLVEQLQAYRARRCSARCSTPTAPTSSSTRASSTS